MCLYLQNHLHTFEGIGLEHGAGLQEP